MTSADTEVGLAPNRYASATAGIRSTARWITAALAAVGTVMIGGLQLTALGELEREGEYWRVVPSVVLVLLALGVVVYAIAGVVAVFTDEWVTLREFDEDNIRTALAYPPTHKRGQLLRQLEGKVNAASPELFAHLAEKTNDLHAHVREVNTQSRAVLSVAHTPAGEGERQVVALADQVHAAAGAAVDCANYHRTLGVFRMALRRLLGSALLLSLIMLAFSLIAVTPDNPQRVEIVTPHGVLPTPTPGPMPTLNRSPTVGRASSTPGGSSSGR